jgi:protein-S-isoprenylcysteine O-methyltransferase Ste14
MIYSKDAADVKFFPPAIPLITIVVGIGIEWLAPLSDNFPMGPPTRVVIGVLLIVASLLLLGLWSVLLFRRGGQSENPWKPTTHIEKRGPYRFTRNPMYLQMVLVCVGAGIALGNNWILILVPAVMAALYLLVIQYEEAYLLAKFGNAYSEYKQSVRRWL